MSAPQLSIVVPVYNEPNLIESVLRRVLASLVEKEVIVVDDGSTQATKDVLARLQKVLPIRVMTHPRNQGKGAAVRTGFQAATGDIVIIQAADLEYDPGDYPTLMRTNTLYGFHATDYEGYYKKAFTRQVIQETLVTANGFEFDNELICKFLRRHRKIAEVPIHYAPRSNKEGKRIR